jgi:hypothetical protein
MFHFDSYRIENKTILYAIVGLLSRKMCIGIKFPQIYIIRDAWRETDLQYTWLRQN